MPYALDTSYFSGVPGYVPEQGVRLSDYAKNAQVGVTGMQSILPALTRYGIGTPDNDYENGLLQAAQFAQEQTRQQQGAIVKGMSPDAQSLINAAVGSSEFWSQPFAWVGLQAAGSSPSLAAAVVGGVLTGGTATGGLLTAGLISGGLSATDFLETAQRSVDEKSDGELQNDSALYRQMRQQGMDEQLARAHFAEEISRNAVPLLFAAGAVLGAAGLPGQTLRAFGPAAVRQAITRQAPRGIAKRLGQETGIGAGTETAQTTIESLVGQQAAVNAGYQPDVDVAEALRTGVGAGLVGAAIGAVTGLPRDYQPPAPALPGGPAQGGAGPAVQGPPPPPPGYPGFIGPPQGMPPGFIGPPPGGFTNGPQVVPPGAPSPAQAAALNANNPGIKQAVPASPRMGGGIQWTNVPTQPAQPGQPQGGQPAQVVPGYGPAVPATPTPRVGGAPVQWGPAPVQGPPEQGPRVGGQPVQWAPPQQPRTPSQVQQDTGVPLAEAVRIAQSEGWKAQAAWQKVGDDFFVTKVGNSLDAAIYIKGPPFEWTITNAVAILASGRSDTLEDAQAQVLQAAQKVVPQAEQVAPQHTPVVGVEPVLDLEQRDYQQLLGYFRKDKLVDLQNMLEDAIGAEPGDPTYIDPMPSAAIKQVIAEQTPQVQPKERVGPSVAGRTQWGPQQFTPQEAQAADVQAGELLLDRLIGFLARKSGMTLDDYAEMHGAHSELGDDELRAVAARAVSPGNPQSMLEYVSARRELRRREPRLAPAPQIEPTTPEEAAALRAQQTPQQVDINAPEWGKLADQMVIPGMLTDEEAGLVNEALNQGLGDRMPHNLEQIQQLEHAPDYPGEKIFPAPEQDLTEEQKQAFGNKGKAFALARAKEDKDTADLFRQHANFQPKATTNTRNLLRELRDALRAVVDASDNAGIKTRRQIDYESTANETFWLNEAKRVYKVLSSNDLAKPTKLQVQEASGFMANQWEAFNNNNWEPFKTSRKIAGEEMMRPGSKQLTDDEGNVLEAGTLLQTPETAPEGETYAITQEGTAQPVGMFEQVPETERKARAPTEEQMAAAETRAVIPGGSKLKFVKGEAVEEPGKPITVTKFTTGPPLTTRTKTGETLPKSAHAEHKPTGKEVAKRIAPVTVRGKEGEVTRELLQDVQLTSVHDALQILQDVTRRGLIKGSRAAQNAVAAARTALEALEAREQLEAKAEAGDVVLLRRLSDEARAGENPIVGLIEDVRTALAEVRNQLPTGTAVGALKEASAAFERFAKKYKVGKTNKTALRAKATRLRNRATAFAGKGLEQAKEIVGRKAPFRAAEAQRLRAPVKKGGMGMRGVSKEALYEPPTLTPTEEAHRKGTQAFQAGRAIDTSPYKLTSLGKYRTAFEAGWREAETRSRKTPTAQEQARITARNKAVATKEAERAAAGAAPLTAGERMLIEAKYVQTELEAHQTFPEEAPQEPYRVGPFRRPEKWRSDLGKGRWVRRRVTQAQTVEVTQEEVQTGKQPRESKYLERWHKGTGPGRVKRAPAKLERRPVFQWFFVPAVSTTARTRLLFEELIPTEKTGMGRRFKDRNLPTIADTERLFRFYINGQGGHVILEPINDGKGLKVRWIGGDAPRRPGGPIAPLKLGPVAVRQILAAVREQFPGAETIEGARAGGAKTRGTEGLWVDTKIKLAAEEAKIERLPSPAKVKADNYRKGHLRLFGMDISLEVPRRGLRRGTRPPEFLSLEEGKARTARPGAQPFVYYDEAGIVPAVQYQGRTFTAPNHYEAIQKAAKVFGPEVQTAINSNPNAYLGFLEAAPTWQVRMKFPYGAIPGTTSADGQNLDITLGPLAFSGKMKVAKPATKSAAMPVTELGEGDPNTRIFVIQQNHVDGPLAGTFDENKVMAGFQNWEAAKAAYIGSFSDGKGEQRIGDYKPMTVEQFKDWAKNPRLTTKPAQAAQGSLARYLSQGTGRQIFDPNDPEGIYRGLGKLSYHIAPEAWAAMTPEQQLAAIDNMAAPSDELREYAQYIVGQPATGKLGNYLNNDIVDGVIAATPPHLRARMRKLIGRVIRIAGDVDVHVVDNDFFERVQKGSTGSYSSDFDKIMLPQSSVNTTTVLHEAAHAAVMRTVHSNPQLATEGEALLDDVVAAARDTIYYGMTSVDEMMASFFNSEKFRNFLQGTAPKLNLWGRIKAWIMRVLGRPTEDVGLLERLMGFTERAQEQALAQPFERGSYVTEELQNRIIESTGRGRNRVLTLRNRLARETAMSPIERRHHGLSPLSHSYASDVLYDLRNRAPDWVAEKLGAPERQDTAGIPWLLRLKNTDAIVQGTGHLGTDFNAEERNYSNAGEMQRVTAHEEMLRYQPVLDEFFKLQQSYKSSPARQALWDRFVQLLHNESKYEIDAGLPATQAAQPHLFTQAGNPTRHSAQGRGKWAALNNELMALPQDMQDARLKALGLYKDLQTRRRNLLGENRMAELVAGVPVDPAMVQRILSNTETAADTAHVGGVDNIKAIRAAARMTNARGPYYPFIRRGDYVVNALYKIARPPAGQARPVPNEPNIFEFYGTNAEANAERYAQSVDQKAIPTKQKDAAGNDVFHVEVQDQHTEFFDTMNEARTRAAELEHMPDIASVQGAQPTRLQHEGLAASLEHRELTRILGRLDKSKTFTALSATEKNLVKQAITHAALQSMASTRISASRLPRKYVEGMSTDFVRNMWDYTQSASSDYASLKHKPARDAAMDKMEELTKTTSKELAGARRAVLNEFQHRARLADRTGTSTKFDGAIQRMTQLAFVYFLGSPAYTMTQLLQVPMVTQTHLAGIYGPGTATAQIAKAYRDVSAGRLIWEGMKATGQRILLRPETEDTFTTMMNGVAANANEKRMLQRLKEVGSLGSETGLDMGRMIRNPGTFDRVLDNLTQIARAMPKMAEMLNRSVSALATYRAELERNGGDHDAATLKAQEVVNLTHGLYSASDAAPIFNTKLGQLTLVFRKFGALMFNYMGVQIGKAIRNTNPGDRKQALLALGYMMGATTLMAGTLGLPNDPFKALLLGLNAVGVDFTWADVEFFERELATKMFGGLGGELVTRGLPRLVGLDLSQRVGLSDLVLHGQPETLDARGWGSYLWDVFAGAPIGMVTGRTGAISALQDLGEGDVLTAAAKFAPMKILRDSVYAYQRATEGKVSKAGYQTMEPTGLGPALVRTFGITPAYEAEVNEAEAQYFRQQRRQDTNRNDLLHAYQKAGASKRSSVWANEIVPWNRTQPKEVQITRADLASYSKRRKSEESYRNIRINRTNRALVGSVREAYPSF